MIEVTESGARETQDVISRSPPFVRRSTSAFGGEWVIPNATRGLSLFSVNLATKGLVHLH